MINLPPRAQAASGMHWGHASIIPAPVRAHQPGDAEPGVHVRLQDRLGDAAGVLLQQPQSLALDSVPEGFL